MAIAREIRTETVVFDMVKLAISRQLTGEALASLRVDLHEDFARDLFNVRALWSTVADVPRLIEYPVIEWEPASWFQMFKRQHFPVWAVRRWPIRTKSHTRIVLLRLRQLYPEAPAPANFGRPIVTFADPASAYRSMSA
jgi:hypothetical protein